MATWPALIATLSCLRYHMLRHCWWPLIDICWPPCQLRQLPQLRQSHCQLILMPLLPHWHWFLFLFFLWFICYYAIALLPLPLPYAMLPFTYIHTHYARVGRHYYGFRHAAATQYCIRRHATYAMFSPLLDIDAISYAFLSYWDRILLAISIDTEDIHMLPLLIWMPLLATPLLITCCIEDQ